MLSETQAAAQELYLNKVENEQNQDLNQIKEHVKMILIWGANF